MIASADTQRCTVAEWEEFRKLVAHGMLFEVMDWIDHAKPTLRPEKKHTSAFEVAVLAPNLSMTQVLWERAWQEQREVVSAFGLLAWQRTSGVVMRYLLENGCPVDHVSGSDLCLFHDLELVRLGMARGVSLLEPAGWASAFVCVGSRPLIRLYLEERKQMPELRKDATWALCKCIAESRLRATALLLWAGVDPLGKAPRYDNWDDPEDEWDGFPALRLSQSKKAGELMKLLKLRPTTEQWFELLEATVEGQSEIVSEVMNLRGDPDAVFRENSDRATAMLRGFLQSLCWGWFPDRLERIEEFCIRLLDKGVQLWWEDMDDLADFRRRVYRSDSRTRVFKVLSVAAERAQGRSKIEMAELVRTPKMRELVIQNDPMILKYLGLPGPADYTQPSPSWRRGQQRGSAGAAPRQTQNRSHSDIVPLQSAIKQPAPAKPKPKPHVGHLVSRPGWRVLDRKEIYADVWTEPAMHVAKRYGISGSMLARICTHLKIPRPPRGYWARPSKARKGMKPPLPKWRSDEEASWAINPVNVRAQQRNQT